MTLKPRSTEQPADNDDAKRPTLHKATIRDLEPATSDAQNINGGMTHTRIACTGAASGC